VWGQPAIKKVKMTNENRVSQIRTPQSEPEREQRIFTFKATQLIWLFFGIFEVLIALRIGLLLIGANPNNPIVALIYGLTYLFLLPFTWLISSPTAGSSKVLDLSSMFAILIYSLIASVVVWLIFYRRRRGAVVGVPETTTSEQHTTP
jgi:YggT family protein